MPPAAGTPGASHYNYCLDSGGLKKNTVRGFDGIFPVFRTICRIMIKILQGSVTTYG